MKSADIKILKELSQDVVDLMPCGLMVDVNKNIYKMPSDEDEITITEALMNISKAEVISIIDLLILIEEARQRVLELNHAVQKIGGRKSPQNNDEDALVSTGANSKETSCA